MRAIVKLALASSLALVITHTGANGQSSDQAKAQDRVLNEIIELRADVMEYLLDAQDRKIQALKLALEEVQHKQRRLQDEERQRLQQITDVEQQLASPQLDRPERPQIEVLGVQLATESAEKLRTEQAKMGEREAEIIQGLDREIQRGRKLQEKARQLQAVLGRQ